MKSRFVNYFSKISPLSEKEAQAISDSIRIENFKKGTILLREGQASIETYFVLEGCIREFVESEGEERTTNFFTEDQWVISLSNFNPQNPSSHNLICIEDCTLAVGNEKEAQKMFEQFPRFETISRVIMEDYFAEQKKLLTSFLTASPEQRYVKLLESRPGLFQRVPQYQLASYIGVKPESLSRIRKRITKNMT